MLVVEKKAIQFVGGGVGNIRIYFIFYFILFCHTKKNCVSDGEKNNRIVLVMEQEVTIELCWL